MWRFPIGVDSYPTLVDPNNHYLYVDKSDFIERVLNDGSENLIIMRTRRWGKSLTLSMLQHFLAAKVYGVKTAPLFQTTYLRDGQSWPLKIATVDNRQFLQQHQGQYVVIFISLKDVKERNAASALLKLKLQIANLYQDHPELADSAQLLLADKDYFGKISQYEPVLSDEQYENALFMLSKLLYKHYGKKVWILIDEYDTPLNHAYGDEKYLAHISGFMRNLLSCSLKSNPYLAKGVLTGVLRISKGSLLSGLNNFRMYSLLTDQTYGADLGFTEQEVVELFTQAGLIHEIEAVRQWYNGYSLGGRTLYNPWSIINCVASQGRLLPYWVNTAEDKLLTDALLYASAEVKKQFEQLVHLDQHISATVSESIRFAAIQRDPHALWSLLPNTGYLTGELVPEQLSYAGRLRIPNKEVRCLYLSVFSHWLTRVFNGKTIPLVNALVQGDIARFAELLEYYLLAHASSRNLYNEGSYHNLVLGLMA